MTTEQQEVDTRALYDPHHHQQQKEGDVKKVDDGKKGDDVKEVQDGADGGVNKSKCDEQTGGHHHHDHVMIKDRYAAISSKDFYSQWYDKENELDAESKYVCSQCQVLVSWKAGHMLETCRHVLCLQCLRTSVHSQLEVVGEEGEKENEKKIENEKNENEKEPAKRHIDINCPLCHLSLTKQDLKTIFTQRHHRAALSLSHSLSHSHSLASSPSSSSPQDIKGSGNAG